jgi:hypothetical protein
VDRTRANEPPELATLASSDGWNAFMMHFVRALRHRGEDLALAKVTVVGRFWEREKTLDSYADADLTDDYHVELPQVLISGSRLRECVNLLEAWLRIGSDFSLDLARNDGQALSLTIGNRSDLICSEGHPAFTMHYSTARIEAEFYFLTDQSCIRLFSNGLSKWLGHLPSSIA